MDNSILKKGKMNREPDELVDGVSPRVEELIPPISPTKQRRVKGARRLSGRPAANTSAGNLEQSLVSLTKLSSGGSNDPVHDPRQEKPKHSQKPHNTSQLISQVRHWLHQEKVRRSAQRPRTKDGASKASSAASATASVLDKLHRHAHAHRKPYHRRSSSDLSEGALALKELEQILEEGLDLSDGAPTDDKRSSYFPRRKSSRLLYRKQSTIGGSSDTDNRDFDELVPSADVVLNNTRTLGCSGGAEDPKASKTDLSKRAIREKEAWLQFKTDIVRLAHTLKLRGWRRVPIERGGDINVVRLSGAMTNAVYVVSPPETLPPATPDALSSTASIPPKKPPSKLLLRIYGPQAEHLIDREVELQILKRLAQKSIGPHLLGTFVNGRFEQYFNARTLTARDLRNPETSRQIAKRMRELHDGIELLDNERATGPFIWQNWDKWVQRCEEVVTWVDREIDRDERKTVTMSLEKWRERGLVCGVSWSLFRKTVDRYRAWLEDLYGGPAAIKRDLVFAHNDTQYGNLLRLQPSGESPLLIPANEHKQLVVIDFEYASANVPGLEFANHFTEWCYDYHEKEKPYGLKANRYPTPEEQRRFIDAYVQHRPFQTQPLSPTLSTSSSTMGGRNSISSFVLDSRAPPAQISEDEKRRDEAREAEVNRLMHETRIWRIANSAQWVAWGIVQAKVPGMDDALKDSSSSESPKFDEGRDPNNVPDGNPKSSTSTDANKSSLGQSVSDLHDNRAAQNTADGLKEDIQESKEEEDEEDFDYLGYAQERTMFFWGDVLQLGLVKKEELPQELLDKVKIVEY